MHSTTWTPLWAFHRRSPIADGIGNLLRQRWVRHAKSPGRCVLRNGRKLFTYKSLISWESKATAMKLYTLSPCKDWDFFTSPWWICFNESPPFMVIEWVWYLDASEIFIHEGSEVWKDMNVSSTSFVFQSMLKPNMRNKHEKSSYVFFQLRTGSNIFQQIPSWRCLDLWFKL